MKIKLAAVRHNKTAQVFADSCHAFAFLKADASLGFQASEDSFTQGFVLNTGAFVDRFEAFEIAAGAGQLEADTDTLLDCGFDSNELISEQVEYAQ